MWSERLERARTGSSTEAARKTGSGVLLWEGFTKISPQLPILGAARGVVLHSSCPPAPAASVGAELPHPGAALP